MADYNPFKNLKKAEYPLIPRGQYAGELADVVICKGKDRDGKEVDKIRFVFIIDVGGKPQKVFKTVYPGRKTTGQFIMTLRSVAPDLWDERYIEDDDQLWEFTKSLIGRHVMLYVTINDKWNNIEAIAPVLQPQTATVQEAPVQDDIPF